MERQDVITLEEFLQFFEERPAINITQFSIESGVSAAHLRHIKNGRHNLTGKTIEKIWPFMLKYGYGYDKGQKKTTTSK